MPASPTSSPQRRPLNEQLLVQSEKLHIRLVPYSPPRLSSDGPTPARPASLGNPPQRFSLDNVEIHRRDDSPRTATPPVSSFTISAPIRNDHGNSPQPHLDSSYGDRTIARQAKFLRSSVSLTPSLSPSCSPSMSTSPSLRRPKRVINVNSDKTFSLVPQAGFKSSRADSISSPHLSSTTPSSSYGRLSSGIFDIDRSSSSMTSLAEHSASPESTASAATPPSKPNHEAISPRNYCLVGGLRKVRSDTSDCGLYNSPQATESDLLPPPKEIAPRADLPPALTLATKQSFQSSECGSALSERTNYKVYSRSSPVSGPVDDSAVLELESPPPSSSDSNYACLGGSGSTEQSSDEQSRPRSGESEANYVIHGGLSRASSIGATTRSQVRPEYSNESLVVAPLRPTKSIRPEHQLSVSQSQSQDSLRTGSLTSMSSFIMNQDTTRASLTGSAAVSAQGGMDWQNWRASSNVGLSTRRKSFSRPQQWSTALPTVFSENEKGSETGSDALPCSPGNGPRNCASHVNHGKRTGSFSSTLAGLDETVVIASHSRTVSLDRPLPVYSRELFAGNSRLIRDQDEDGDGIADLEELYRRPSRVRHYSLLSCYSSDRSLKSSSSSRANSLNYASIPTWARLYYGSGERRFLATKPSYDSMFSQFSDSQPRNSILSQSPSNERFAPAINNPRCRPREDQPQVNEPGLMEITPHPILAVARSLKKQTSSIWSPHLRQDRRASRYNIWAPPPLAGPTRSNLLWRNIQLVLFVLGFILPFAWIIGALLPLPAKPSLEMLQRDRSTSHFDLRLASRHEMQDMNELRLHDRTRWWRSVNRRMSIIGLLLIGAYIALIVVGVRQQWNSR